MDMKKEACKHFLGWFFSLAFTDVDVCLYVYMFLNMIIIINGCGLHISGGNVVYYWIADQYFWKLEDKQDNFIP